jgi:acyl-coenzyme A thioesterase PaaI-like protein
MQDSVIELPFNIYFGIQKSLEPTELLLLPANKLYLNHLGTVHAIAQIALAEASSAEFLLRSFGSSAGYIPVVRRLESKFRKPANGVIRSKTSTPPEAIEQLRADLVAKGRATISIAIELYDESGTHTLSATFEWFIMRVSNESRNA